MNRIACSVWLKGALLRARRGLRKALLLSPGAFCETEQAMRFIPIALAASRAPEVTPTTLTLADAYSHTPGHPLLGTASLASASTTTATTTQSIGNAVDDMLKDMCK